MSRFLRDRLTAVDSLAILGCAALAVALSLFLRGYELRLAVPVMFLLLIITAAQIITRLAAFVIAAIGCLIFALILFEPYGRLAVQDGIDRVVLSGFALVAIAIVALAPKTGRQKLTHYRFRK